MRDAWREAGLTPDEERWAEALAIEQTYGEHAPLFIAERIGAAVLAGDETAIARWKEIATKLDALRPRQANSS